jgi:LPXTG-motif cell wall-anchored protein
VRLTGVDDLGNPVTRSTATSPAGLYAFTGLRAGTYTVTFDPASLPAGSRFTFRNVGGGTPATDSDGDVLTGAVTYVLAAGESVLELDQGLLTMNPSIAVTKYINGDDAQTAPGVTVAAGSTMSITYRVTNTGDTVLDPVRLTDDKVAAEAISCPATALAAGESMTCTASLPAPAPGTQHVNTATVTGTPPAYPDETQLPDVTASDVAHANTPAPPVVVPPAVLPVTPPALARTGEDSQAALRLAVASLLLGLGLVVAGRRRAVR